MIYKSIKKYKKYHKKRYEMKIKGIYFIKKMWI